MRNLHPVMAQFLAPFTRAIGVSPGSVGRLPAFVTPPVQSCQICYEWDGGLGESIDCRLTYEPGERGMRERGTGLQLEPDWPEFVELTAAYLLGVDVLPLLSCEQIARIEELARQTLEN